MAASPYPRSVKPAFGRVFAGSLWLWLIPYPKGERAQAPLCDGAFLDFDRRFKDAPNPIILLEKFGRTGNRIGPLDKALNQVLQNLIQNVQWLNQKVK
jgi:hypothetical protein